VQSLLFNVLLASVLSSWQTVRPGNQSGKSASDCAQLAAVAMVGVVADDLNLMMLERQVQTYSYQRVVLCLQSMPCLVVHPSDQSSGVAFMWEVLGVASASLALSSLRLFS
jgi:hypothetical protein